VSDEKKDCCEPNSEAPCATPASCGSAETYPAARAFLAKCGGSCEAPCENEIHEHIRAFGVSPALLADAKAAGLDWLTILQLLVQYGPMVADVIRQIIDAFKKKQPAAA
jgi:hypothetical protein